MFLCETVVLGVTRGTIGLAFEQPFETIKTQWQNKYNARNLKEITNIIYKDKGFIGFYRGFIPNLIKYSYRNVYRWPLMIYLPNTYHKKLKDKPYFFESLPKILTGKYDLA